MSIHRLIRQGRLRLGMTEKQFADGPGVSRGAVQQWERPGDTAPKRSNQPAVARLLKPLNPSDQAAGPCVDHRCGARTHQTVPIEPCGSFHRDHKRTGAIEGCMTCWNEVNLELPLASTKVSMMEIVAKLTDAALVMRESRLHALHSQREAAAPPPESTR
jgi:DNA-binding XRE family transcriptional regulator